MNAIQETLEQLHSTPGIKVASVVTLDGLVAAEVLDERFRSDVIAGLASYLLMTTNKSLREGGFGECSQFLLHATHGKVILSALRDAYLVVVFDQFADMASVRASVKTAALRIRNTSRID
ncbi:MAG: roadblock/LC7 domain-containing protein [Planctomycetes bacterium]|nr:roadblock/LC7 domain-containing protein [Planctomycetota bacterium]